jgi:hypothetical protein
MRFVNHDSDKSKFHDRIFFQKISEKKHIIYRKILRPRIKHQIKTKLTQPTEKKRKKFQISP